MSKYDWSNVSDLQLLLCLCSWVFFLTPKLSSWECFQTKKGFTPSSSDHISELPQTISHVIIHQPDNIRNYLRKAIVQIWNQHSTWWLYLMFCLDIFSILLVGLFFVKQFSCLRKYIKHTTYLLPFFWKSTLSSARNLYFLSLLRWSSSSILLKQQCDQLIKVGSNYYFNNSYIFL